MHFSIDKIQEYIKDKNIPALKYLKQEYNLKIVDGKLIIDPKEGKRQEVFWNQRQQARKILLNSLNFEALSSN